jgi:hypothetical protein
MAANTCLGRRIFGATDRQTDRAESSARSELSQQISGEAHSMRVVWTSTAIFAVLMVMLGVDFLRRATPLGTPLSGREVAVVFTGQFNRVELGLLHMEHREVSMLFISGVNSGAGIQPDGFAAQFGLSVTLQAAVTDGRIILASDASTTLENAIETACWLEMQDEDRPVVLITNRFHMPRASLALERATSQPIHILRTFPELVLPASEATFSWRELLKFAATWGITLFPTHVWPSQISPDCTG